MDTGIAILSQVPANQVPSPLRVLTSVFGMRTGGSPALKTPVMVESSFPNIHNCIAKINISKLKFRVINISLIEALGLLVPVS